MRASEKLTRRSIGAMERHDDLTLLLLPEDVLVTDVLGRLPPHSLAVLRCVGKAWRAFIDGHRLLRLDLPHSVASIVVNLHELRSPQFLSRPAPSSTPLLGPCSTISAKLDHTVSGKLEHLRNPSVYIKDHCSGLLLVHDCVVNPATGQFARLPRCLPRRSNMRFCYSNNYLVFDPAVSPHYEVFAIPRIRYEIDFEDRPYCDLFDQATEAMEWPPSPCIMQVFSSLTRRWEEKSFVREGEAAGAVVDMRVDTLPRKRYAVYWQGALYVHCETNFVMRISLSNGKYRVIKPVIGTERVKHPNICLGRSENGVYCAFLEHWRLHVWFLSDSHGQMEWVLNHMNDMWPLLPHRYDEDRSNGPWVLNHVNSYEDHKANPYEQEENVDLDSHIPLDLCRGESYNLYYITLLGFHPYEEVVFLGETFETGIAYHLKSSKIEELGNLRPPSYKDVVREPYMEASYIYTPCLVGKFPESHESTRSSSR